MSLSTRKQQTYLAEEMESGYMRGVTQTISSVQETHNRVKPEVNTCMYKQWDNLLPALWSGQGHATIYNLV